MNAANRFKKKIDISYARYLKSKRADRYHAPEETTTAEKHTLRVAFLKKFIMRMVILLVVLLIAWPLANRNWDSKINFGGGAAQQKTENNLPVMLKPKFFGSDNDGQPFHLTAVSGVSVNSNKIVLNELTGDMISKSNSKIFLSSHHGDYTLNEKVLVLNDGVVISTETGYQFTTNSAYVKLSENTANGSEKVLIKGPIGDITAKGFTIRESGDEIVLYGGVDLNGILPDEDVDKMNELNAKNTNTEIKKNQEKREEKYEKKSEN